MATLICGCDPSIEYSSQECTDAGFCRTARKIQEARLPNETRVVDAKTGGEKGSKLARFDLIPAEAVWALAEHYGRGCAKYADRNWERGYDWGLSVAALERHLTQWKLGESIDAETGSHHLIAVAWHAFALFIFEIRKLGTDTVRRHV